MLFDNDFWSILTDLGKKNEMPREPKKGQRPKFFSSLVVLGGSWGPLGSFGGLVGAKITFKTPKKQPKSPEETSKTP